MPQIVRVAQWRRGTKEGAHAALLQQMSNAFVVLCDDSLNLSRFIAIILPGEKAAAEGNEEDNRRDDYLVP